MELNVEKEMSSFEAHQDDSLKVLVADDNDSDRLILSTIIKNAGHEVVCARNGQEAVDFYIEHRPDIVLLDALMPVMDGFEAAEKIRVLAAEEAIPIVFLTSLKDANSLAKCLDAGGTDFLSKPYNKVILTAKVRALGRLRRLQSVVREQRDRLAVHHEHLIREQEVAKRVFDNIAHPGCINAPCVRAHLSPMSVFNGDMVLASRKPDGGMYVLIGDFSGHGLPAAIGAMPASEIFYGMTNKGFSLQEIIAEINKKLAHILPVGVFCCCALVEFSMDKNIIQVWSGGLPDLFIYRPDDSREGGEIINVPSKHLPLGVLSAQRFNTEVQVFEMQEGDRFFLWTDGILEANNIKGEMFGSERLVDIFNKNHDSTKIFDEILDAVDVYTGRQAQDDDHTLVEITMVPQEEFDSYFGEKKQEKLSQKALGPMDWCLEYTLLPQTLKDFNPLPLLTHVLMEVPGLRNHSSKLYTILAELYSNALEHGVLGISSGLKTTAHGFAEYYRQREAALSKDFEGSVKFVLRHKPEEGGGVLIIRVEDTGKGFDFKGFEKKLSSKEGYCGRGIPLLLGMCRRFEYFGTGNIVEAEFEWRI